MIAVRVLPRFPAKIGVGAGLGVIRSAGIYTFSLHFETLIPGAAITNPDATYVPVWDADSESYLRLTATAFGQALSFGLAGVSTSTVTVGTGSKDFTASTARAWVVGQRLRVASDDGTKVMSGTVTAYSSSTGALTITVDYILGSGSHSDWNITVTGDTGATGSPGAGSGDVVGPASSTDGYFALFNAGTGKLLKQSTGGPGALAFLATVGAAQIDAGSILPSKRTTPVSLSDGATPALDASLGDVFDLIAAGNRTIAVPSLPRSGQKIVIRHSASGGARTLSLNTGTGGFRYGTDITGLTATESGKTDHIGCIYDATDNKWDVVGYAKGYG